ncbi:GD22019 [Drosophila simulans]|uniref:GD22019 n=1 Tax=Drosophila simulans TaxID=7240 RepID=B4Q5H2_DROSI|nr:GD22019 [Drosophila simulans]
MLAALPAFQLFVVVALVGLVAVVIVIINIGVVVKSASTAHYFSSPLHAQKTNKTDNAPNAAKNAVPPPRRQRVFYKFYCMHNRHTLSHTHTHTPGERRTEIRIRMRTQTTGNALGLSGSDGTLSTAPALSRPTVQSFNRSIAQPLCKKATDSTTRNRNTN